MQPKDSVARKETLPMAIIEIQIEKWVTHAFFLKDNYAWIWGKNADVSIVAKKARRILLHEIVATR